MKKKEIAALKRVQALAGAQGHAKGSDRRIAEAMLVRSWIDGKLLEAEPDMLGMAWIGYRYMTPLERTQLFTTEYEREYLAAYARAFPDEDVSKKRPINPIFVANDVGVMNALWRARAEADMAGVPYDVYLKIVISGHLVNDKWKRPPRPNQLYGKLVEPRLRDMEDRSKLRHRVYGSDWDERFFALAYRGDENQEAALGYLKRAVNDSEDPVRTLSEFLCERKAITVERAAQMFGEQLVASARSMSSEAPVEIPGPQGRFIPACFGYPDTDEISSCQTCTVNKQCLTFSGLVRSEMVRTLGTDDPRREWKKQVNRNRQRRRRARSKDADWTDLVDADLSPPENAEVEAGSVTVGVVHAPSLVPPVLLVDSRERDIPGD